MPRSAGALVVTVVGLALAGCAPAAGDGGTAAPASPESAALGPATLTVFAAASLTEAFEELAIRFEERNPSVDVALNFGGSAGLAQQIAEGAPADVFAAAAEAPMQALTDAGLAADPVVFATNTLALVVPAGNPAGIAGLDDLARAELRVALCDPSVPCGAASATLLDAEGVVAAPDTLESDVKSVLTKVSLGEVDAALVYRTDVLAAGDAVEGVDVPAAASVVNRYPIAAVAGSANADAAAAFVALVTGEDGREELDRLGFGAP
ncbi:MAG TPA: molybdate ABC transporter substrate-binding protein [Agromyces sp.]|nr:molybdate ABC transporter substrate-binding protein [Agromyces sp.]